MHARTDVPTWSLLVLALVVAAGLSFVFWPRRKRSRPNFVQIEQEWVWPALVIAAAPIVFAVLYVVFWPLSDWIARHDVGAITGPHRATALLAARDAARGHLLTFGAGVFAFGALIYTGRNFTLSRRTFELTEQGQVTDRYTRAIEQLGSDKLEVRIGGIYALERIAYDSPRDHPTVMEVLATFIREHSGEQWPPSVPVEAMRGTRPDVQAAVTVIGRRAAQHDIRRLKLAQTKLPRADLTKADLVAAELHGADLYNAKLARAHLQRADLTGANLRDANLAGAHLSYATLLGTDLTHALIQGANFTRAELLGAIWPEHEQVPEGWVRDSDGRLERAEST